MSPGMIPLPENTIPSDDILVSVKPVKRAPLHLKTPLVYSPSLSINSGANVYLKMENYQPSGSFKTRGIGALALSAFEEFGSEAHLVTSSGGNAGLACAYSARALGLACTIVCPSSTQQSVLLRLKTVGASKVIVEGSFWDEADKLARKIVSEDPKAVYIPPFDHPKVIEGNSSMIPEIRDQLKAIGINQPDGIIASVGGGGMMAGVLKGLDEVGWKETYIVGVETFGAASMKASLEASYKANPPQLTMATLPVIDTIANTLGARQVCKSVVESAFDRKEKFTSLLVEDSRCVSMIEAFAAEHQVLVEPAACSLVPFLPFHSSTTQILHSVFPSLASKLVADPNGERPPPDAPVLVVIVCGGCGVSIQKVLEWKEKFNDGKKTDKVEVFCQGKSTELELDRI